MDEMPMASTCRQPIALVLEALKGVGAAHALQGGAIRFSFDSVPLEGEARLDEEWLGLRGSFPASDTGPWGGTPLPPPWDLLSATSSLSGGAKFALDGNGGGAFLAAEVPIEAGLDPLPRIAEALLGLRSGAIRQCWGKDQRQPASPPSPAPGGGPAGPPARIRELCLEAGWPVEERSGGRLCARLEGLSQ